MLHHLDATRRLRNLYPYPQGEANMEGRIRKALIDELSEVQKCFKPTWSWWKSGPIDREHLIEEIADVIFFTLISVQDGIEQGEQVEYKHFSDQFFHNLALSEMYYRNPKHDLGSAVLHDKAHEIIQQIHAHAAYVKNRFTFLGTTTGRLFDVLFLMGYDRYDLELAYVNKFLENIKRTGKGDTREGKLLTQEYKQKKHDLEVIVAKRELEKEKAVA